MPSHRADTPALRRPGGSQVPPDTAARRATPQLGTRRTAPDLATRRATRRPAARRSPSLSLSAPQAGIAGALGIATIAAPISGAMASPAPKVALNPIRAVSVAPAFPGELSGPNGVEALSVVPPSAASTSPGILAAPRTVIVSRASRSGERSVLPGCDGENHAKGAANGQLPASALCTLWDGHYKLRGDAAVALAKMNLAYKQHFGDNICLSSGYRSYSQQASLRAEKPGLAAPAGTSNHGWGLAVDLCDGVETGVGARYQWLRDNASNYGFANPDWALRGGVGPYEPWHWEFVDGEASVGETPAGQ